MSKPLDQTLGVLTGAVGDFLARTGNALATPMSLIYQGQPRPAEREALRAAYPDAQGRAVLLIHGLMATEHGFLYTQADAGAPPRDYATELHAAHGLTPLRLRYNTGVAREDNARDLDRLLDQLVAAWPVPLQELVLVCHSMGGLMVREACALGLAGQRPWVGRVCAIAYLGTPHLGAPLERAGRWAVDLLRAVPDPVAHLVSQVADLRSAGIQQLGDPVALPWLAHAQHLLVASSLAGATPLAAVVGDGMVSVRSATAQDPNQPLPPNVQTRVVHGLHHAQLAFNPAVGALLVDWLPPCADPPAPCEASGTCAPPAPRAPPKRWNGLLQLGLDAVTHGHRAVAKVRLGQARQVTAVVQTVLPGAKAPLAAARVVHAAVVTVQHAAIDAGLGVVQAVADRVRPGDAKDPAQSGRGRE